MLVTAIEQRRKSMSAVYIDGEFAMQLDTMTLLANKVRVGMTLTDEQLQELVKQSEVSRAKEKALYLITYRDHSQKELTEKIRRTYSSETAEEVAETMQKLGLVNDEEYARKYANELLRKKHMSPRAIAYKLREKGISQEIITLVSEELTYDPVSEITEILDRKYPDYAHDEKIKRRAVAYLQRMGWNWSDIKSAMT